MMHVRMLPSDFHHKCPLIKLQKLGEREGFDACQAAELHHDAVRTCTNNMQDPTLL